MGPLTKIATCCYCGTRAALVLDKGRQELACRACGAPLTAMKAMRAMPTPAPRAVLPATWQAAHPEGRRVARPKKRRKGLARRLLEELADVVEDIFD